MSIGYFAFAWCSSLNAVVILPAFVSVGSSAFYGDSALTRIDATTGICLQVLDSCSGTCTKFQGCPIPSTAPTRPPSALPTSITGATAAGDSPATDPTSGLSAGVITAIVFSVIAGAAVIALLFWWKYNRSRPQGAVYRPFPGNQKDDIIIEARMIPTGELVVSPPDKASLYSATSVTVVSSSSGQQDVIPTGFILEEL